MADGDKDAVAGKLARLAGVGVAQQHPAHRKLALGLQNFGDGGVDHEVDLVVVLCALEHDFGGAKLGAAVDDGDLGGEFRQVGPFLHGRVAAADDDELLVAKEKAVAGGAGRDPVPHQPPLGFQAEQARRRAGGND